MKRSDMFPSNYLAAADIPDEGLVVTIHHLEEEKMRDGKLKPTIYFEEVKKGMVLNVTNWKTIEGLYGEESDEWKDERITLYASVTTFDEEEVACIRVRKKAPKATMAPADAKPVKATAKAKAGVATQPITPREPGDDDDVDDDDVPY